MTDSEFEKFLTELYDAIDWRELARHILLDNDSNNKVCIFKDGTIAVLRQNEFFYNSTDHVATIFTPGVGNLDWSFFTENFVTWCPEHQAYVVDGKYQDDKGRVVGDIRDVIDECICEGDISCFTEDWREIIERQAEEWRITQEW